nr:glycosyltransferase family 4 protein [Bacteroidales bacterium]
MKKVYSYDPQLYVVTGAHKVMMDVHNAIKEIFNAKVLGTLDYSELHPDLNIKQEEYQKIGNIFSLHNSILIVHQRRIAIKYRLLSFIPFLNLKVVYIHHNILEGNRLLTFLPKNIITISDRCIENLTKYFGVKEEHITKIHNAVRDVRKEEHKRQSGDTIKILYPATIYPVKRQLQVVKYLSSCMRDGIEIIFAGVGDDYEELKIITKNDKRFNCLGFVKNIPELMANVDYCMLFSEKEGLPITLIEATMMGVPIICNDVGGNLEIAKDGYNAFVCNNWEDLAERLNSLESVSEEEYNQLSKNSRIQYERYFDYEIFKSKYIDYISGV